MDIPKYKIALIVGAGEGLSASLARLFAREGIKVALAARKIEKLGALCTETGARAFACNATEAEEVERLFGLVEREMGTPDIVVYNASGRARGAFTDLVPADVEPISPLRSRLHASLRGPSAASGATAIQIDVPSPIQDAP